MAIIGGADVVVGGAAAVVAGPGSFGGCCRYRGNCKLLGSILWPIGYCVDAYTVEATPIQLRPSSLSTTEALNVVLKGQLMQTPVENLARLMAAQTWSGYGMLMLAL